MQITPCNCHWTRGSEDGGSIFDIAYRRSVTTPTGHDQAIGVIANR